MPKTSYCRTTCSDCYHCELADDPLDCHGNPIEFEPTGKKWDDSEWKDSVYEEFPTIEVG